jgi:hypothetical protein
MMQVVPNTVQVALHLDHEPFPFVSFRHVTLSVHLDRWNSRTTNETTTARTQTKTSVVMVTVGGPSGRLASE